MKFAEIQILTHALEAQRAFYIQTLGLSDATTAPNTFTAQVGATRLTFIQAQPDWRADGRGAYHFAFNIPENQFATAKDWLRQRTPLVMSQAGQDEYNFESWNARALYFFDPAGNVVELIARHNLPNASTHPFDGHSLLNVSEISVTAADVLDTVRAIQLALNVEVYDGPSTTFAAVGDEYGLFIVVPAGRTWFPDTGLRADFYPMTVRLEDGRSWSAPVQQNRILTELAMSNPTFRVQQIDHVELFVPERYEAARWYATVFGLAIVPGFEQWATEGGPLMVSSDGGSTKLALFTGDPRAAPCKRVAFRVSGPDYLVFLGRLETLSLTHDSGAPLTPAHTVDHDKSWSIYFIDPWGNRFEITTYDYDHVAENLNHEEHKGH